MIMSDRSDEIRLNAHCRCYEKERSTEASRNRRAAEKMRQLKKRLKKDDGYREITAPMTSSKVHS